MDINSRYHKLEEKSTALRVFLFWAKCVTIKKMFHLGIREWEGISLAFSEKNERGRHESDKENTESVWKRHFP